MENNFKLPDYVGVAKLIEDPNDKYRLIWANEHEEELEEYFALQIEDYQLRRGLYE